MLSNFFNYTATLVYRIVLNTYRTVISLYSTPPLSRSLNLNSNNLDDLRAFFSSNFAPQARIHGCTSRNLGKLSTRAPHNKMIARATHLEITEICKHNRARAKACVYIYEQTPSCGLALTAQQPNARNEIRARTHTMPRGNIKGASCGLSLSLRFLSLASLWRRPTFPHNLMNRKLCHSVKHLCGAERHFSPALSRERKRNTAVLFYRWATYIRGVGWRARGGRLWKHRAISGL